MKFKVTHLCNYNTNYYHKISLIKANYKFQTSFFILIYKQNNYYYKNTKYNSGMRSCYQACVIILN